MEILEEDIDMPEESSTFVSLTTLEVKIPQNAVGALIGRQGCNIKKIQESTSTAIKFRDEENGERTCVIRGKLEKAIKAKEVILNTFQNIPDVLIEELEIPNSMIGKIIGRNGCTIHKIQRMSGANVKVSDLDQNKTSDFAGLQSDYPRKVIIKGTKDQLTTAKSGIFDVMEEERKLQEDIKNSASNISHRSKGFSHQNGGIPSVNGFEVNSLELPECFISSSNFNEVYVSAVATAAHFWVQLVGPKTVQLDKLVTKMSEYYESSENRESHTLTSFETGKVVAAKFNDGMWYRGKIIDPEEEEQTKISVFFVDFGDTDDVERSFVCDLRTDFLMLGFQALECYLADVDIESADNKEATDVFESLSYAAQWKPLMVRVIGYRREGNESIPYVKVIDTNGSQDIDISEEMIKKGLVKRQKDVTSSKSEETCLDTLDNSDLEDLTLDNSI
ncbi:UNVERIFIED_CONTAM: hypothetical protein RMT77_016760 [Armadillidium vulgare]